MDTAKTGYKTRCTGSPLSFILSEKGVLMDQSRISQVKHLFEVEHLSMRQISRLLHLCQRTVSRILAGKERKRRSSPPSPCLPFVRLIEEWYRQYPSLQAA